MAKIYPTTAKDAAGHDRILYLAEADSGDVVGTGDTMDQAAMEAYQRLSGCADVAARRGLPARYVRKLRAEAEMFKPAGV